MVSEDSPCRFAKPGHSPWPDQAIFRRAPLARRVPLLDARFFTTAVLTQRESGGNLAGILDNISAVIRDRFKVKRQIRVVSAHARITGWILICEPPLLALGNREAETLRSGSRRYAQRVVRSSISKTTEPPLFL